MKGATLMEYPHIDRYAEMDSPIHSLDHRMKLVAFFILIFSFVFLPSVNLALIALLASLMILVISGLPKSLFCTGSNGQYLFFYPFFSYCHLQWKAEECLEGVISLFHMKESILQAS